MSTSNSIMDYIQSSSSTYNRLMQEVSTGKRLNNASDGATDTMRVMNINKELSQLEGYNKNMTMAQSELNVLDATLAGLNSNLMRFNDLTLQAVNGTYGNASINDIKTELDGLIDSIISQGNTKFNGNYIFAGANTGTPPFERLGTGGAAYNGTPETGDYQRLIQISEGVTSKINVAGDNILGSFDEAAGTGSGTLQTLFGISNALGATPPDTDAARALLGDLDTNIKNLNTVRAEYGGISKQFQMTKNAIDVSKLQLTSFKSSLEDVDLTTAISDLTMQEYVLQATMAVASQSMQMGLLNYL